MNMDNFEKRLQRQSWRQFAQRSGQSRPERLLIRISRGREQGNQLGAKAFVVRVTRAMPSHQVNGRIVRQTDEKTARIPRPVQQIRLTDKFDEDLLKHIARVVFVAGEIQKERE